MKPFNGFLSRGLNPTEGGDGQVDETASTCGWAGAPLHCQKLL